MQSLRVCYDTTLDVHGIHNLLWVAKGNEWKMVYHTQYGLCESLVMPFSLTNPLADFQHFINDTLHPFLHHFSMAYFNEILI